MRSDFHTQHLAISLQAGVSSGEGSHLFIQYPETASFSEIADTRPSPQHGSVKKIHPSSGGEANRAISSLRKYDQQQ